MKNKAKLKIFMFGTFQISGNDLLSANTMTKKSNSKMWSVLKYLIAFHNQPISADKLAGILLTEGEHDDPARMLRDALYRLRKALAVYGGQQQYIVFNKGNYLWNSEADCWIDILEFDRLIERASDMSKPNKERIASYKAAIDLYEGPFLGDSAGEAWSTTFTNYFRKVFLRTVSELASLYESEYMLDEIVALHEKAIKSEPYEEPLYIKQIQTLITNGEYANARQQYRHYAKLLMREFGVKPSNELEQLSFEIDRASMNEAGDLNDITMLLDTQDRRKGALLCGPETFRKIYVLDKRAEERIRFPVYIALMTLVLPSCADVAEGAGELRDSMRELRRVLVQFLRNSDVVTQYSRNQFALMLTAKDEESGERALRRAKYLFESKLGADRGMLEYSLSQVGRENADIVPSERDLRRT